MRTVMPVALAISLCSMVPVGATSVMAPTCQERFPQLFGISPDRLMEMLRQHGTFDDCDAVALEQYASTEHAAAVVALLIDRSKSPGRDRGIALHVLSRYGEHALPALPELAAALDDPDPTIRATAASTLGFISPRSDAVTARLLQRLGDDSPDVAMASIGALAESGPLPADALPLLIDAARRYGGGGYGPYTVAPRSIDAISHVQSPDVPAALVQLMVATDVHASVAVLASTVVPRFGPDVLPLLRAEQARATDPQIVQRIDDAIRWAGELAPHADAWRSLLTSDALTLRRRLDAPDAAVRLDAVQRLEALAPAMQLGDYRFGLVNVPWHLHRVATGDPVPEIRAAAARALARYDAGSNAAAERS